MPEQSIDSKVALQKNGSFQHQDGKEQPDLPGTPTNKSHSNLVEKFHVRAPRRISMAGLDEAEKLKESSKKKRPPRKPRSFMRRSSFSSAKRALRQTAKSMFQYRRESFNDKSDNNDDPSWEVSVWFVGLRFCVWVKVV